MLKLSDTNDKLNIISYNKYFLYICFNNLIILCNSKFGHFD